MKERIRNLLKETGAVAVGFAEAGPISAQAHILFKSWIEEGCHGEMTYLERHAELRASTESVLPGSKSVISLAFSYFPSEWRSEELSHISAYAYGEDYHTALREKLKPVVRALTTEYGGNWRICIDSAPVAERYWAMRCGIGKRAKNGAIIVDGAGPFCFLVEIVTTLEILPDEPSDEWCEGCGQCLSECPSGALRGDGTMDSTLCINYLTIEKKGEFDSAQKKILRKSGGSLFGCQRCYMVCPHSLGVPHSPTEINKGILNLDKDDLLKMSEETFDKEFGNTPLKYAGLEKLRRNAQVLKEKTRKK